MEDKDQMDDHIGRLKRERRLIASFAQEIAQSSKQIGEANEYLSREVTLLQTSNETIKKTIEKSVLEASDDFAEKTSGLMKPSFNAQTEKITQAIAKLEQEQSGFIRTLKNDNANYKKKLSRTGLAVCLSFCLGSLGSGLGIWYFFPQNTFVRMEFTAEQRSNMEHGALLQFAMPKMSKKEKKKLISLMGSSWDEYYEKMLNMKFTKKKK